MQLKLSIEDKSKVNKKRIRDVSWDFKGANTIYNNHGIHEYPARMIPQIARRLIETYGKNAHVLLDPFMGSGTVLLEAKLHHFKKAYGIDINPLALLIAKVKTTPIDENILWNSYHEIIQKSYDDRLNGDFECPNFFNIDYWFRPQVKADLSILKKNIDDITFEDNEIEKDIKDFFYVTFSSIIRKVSNTRNGEYKLYRMPKSSLKRHNPDVFLEFKKKSESNIKRMKIFNRKYKPCKIKILAEDTRCKTSIPSNHVDIIITSPPYGDSKTTVAYGQFSRLSLQWLGFDRKDISLIDKMSLGGVPTDTLENDLDSPTLDNILRRLSRIDKKRTRDVLSFYKDFYECVKEMDRVMKTGGFCCFVVGNRRVKGVKIPTDKIIVELFEVDGYRHHKTIIRGIPSKRLPKRNSPTNIKGKVESTMNHEYIVILEKI